ncbi:MAG: PepSY domain-containing protein, partial [Novosphingobium sp.]
RAEFADKPVADRVIGYGVAWHEGQLLGLFNQLVGVATALMLITLAVSGFVMWRRRKPADLLGAPPLPPVPARIGGVVTIIAVLAVFLPLLATSLIGLWLVESIVLRRLPAARRWLGLTAA